MRGQARHSVNWPLIPYSVAAGELSPHRDVGTFRLVHGCRYHSRQPNREGFFRLLVTKKQTNEQTKTKTKDPIKLKLKLGKRGAELIGSFEVKVWLPAPGPRGAAHGIFLPARPGPASLGAALLRPRPPTGWPGFRDDVRPLRGPGDREAPPRVPGTEGRGQGCASLIGWSVFPERGGGA